MELLGLTQAELSAYCEKLGFPLYRGRQIADWLYRKGVRDIESMTSLPKDLREKLKSDATISRSEVAATSLSEDGSSKYLLKLSDGETIESVLLPYSDRISICVSTQIGCAMGCVFCATADCGFVRNLTSGEIIDQVLTLQEQINKRVSHVVFMGMGEPLLNFDNVIKAIHILNREIGIGMRRITISTVGITPAIRRLKELDMQITLAISLHAPDDNLRKQLIPVAGGYPLNDLIQACRNYANHTKRRITFEYLLMAGINDSTQQAKQLAGLLKGMLCHVNLIPYNEVPGKPIKRSSKKAVCAFRDTLENEGIEVTQRLERGHEIAAACGQLRRRNCC